MFLPLQPRSWRWHFCGMVHSTETLVSYNDKGGICSHINLLEIEHCEVSPTIHYYKHLYSASSSGATIDLVLVLCIQNTTTAYNICSFLSHNVHSYTSAYRNRNRKLEISRALTKAKS